uniref:Protocadherin alpha-8-like n=1 Tax=Acanthochromis polyacanthus TaxID=80966 RepID=A0A3Q1FYI0_9TELE
MLSDLTMKQRRHEKRMGARSVAGCVVAAFLWSVASAQLRYSISEETNEGTVVGNVAKDLGLDKSTLKDRKYRIVSSDADPLFYVSQNDGVLYVRRKIDREEVCAQSSTHSLVLTALDGGKPPKSGNMNIVVNVLDVNDNTPVFSKDVYSVLLSENAPIGTTVIQVNATDLDDGQNGEIYYSFGNSVSNQLFAIFDINPSTGEITVKGVIDYEQKDKYEIEIEASDKGLAPLTTEKSVIIKIVDVNDNAPEIEVTSFSSSIPEDSRPGTTTIS